MPKRASPKSLLNLCFDNVTSKSFTGLWCNPQFAENHDIKKRRLNVINPFEDIPSTLVENMLSIIDAGLGIGRDSCFIKTRYWPDDQYYEILINPRIRILHLTKGKAVVAYSSKSCSFKEFLRRNEEIIRLEAEKICRLISLASIKCPKLKALKLQGLSNVPEKDYIKFFREFTKLQILDISHSSAENDCMQVLGIFCKDLRVLDITSCPVTDAGIKGLCGVDDLKTGNENGCKFLHTLRINNTKISKIGIRFALENLPALQCFDCSSTVQVLAEMHRAAFKRDQSNLPHYSLITLNLYSTDESPYLNGSLALAASLCYLSVVKVDISIAEELTDTDLFGLLVLKRLEKLVIRNVMRRNRCRITFDGGIAPVLKAVGKSLKELRLDELEICVNIRTIAEFCPDLRFLSLFGNRSYTLAWPEEAQPVKMRSVFQKMETIHLFDEEHFILRYQEFDEDPFDLISSEILLLLLSSPVLKDVSISSCINLSDDILRKSADLHGFYHLEQLKLMGNTTSLTKQAIDDIFMKENNSLKRIFLVDCDFFRNEHFEEWQKLIDEKKWDLSIEKHDPYYESFLF